MGSVQSTSHYVGLEVLTAVVMKPLILKYGYNDLQLEKGTFVV
jgi:hypothetical protein